MLASLLVLSIAPDGFTTGDLDAKVRALTGQPHQDHTVRQASYDLRELRGKQLAVKPRQTRRSRIPGDAAHTIAALLTLRDQVITSSSCRASCGLLAG